MVKALSMTPDQFSTAAALVEPVAGVDWAYDLLDDVCERQDLPDAVLVVHPEPTSLQLFRRGRRPIPPHRIAAFAVCPSGVVDPRDLSPAGSLDRHADPCDASGNPRLRPATSTMLGALCDTHYRALLAARVAKFDTETGLLSRRAIDDALARAAACGARYGWTSTLVVLTTGGDAPADRRWQALAGALRMVLRSGDEAGVLAAGSALVLLGNAGPDAVPPFVARVRAALETTGVDGVDLFSASATTPRESVDGATLRQLALDRLGRTGAVAPVTSTDRATGELEVRAVPGVVWVSWGAGTAPHVTVGAWGADDALVALVTRRVHEHFPEASVSVLEAGAEANDGEGTAPERSDSTAPERSTPGPRSDGDGDGDGDPVSRNAARVLLVGASFDPALGMTEVALARDRSRGVSHAPAGPLVGGAQATLGALGALGADVPFYLVSAERAAGVTDNPVVVVLGARRATTARRPSLDDRIGVAAGTDDAEAASRATLGALNRYLSGPRSS